MKIRFMRTDNDIFGEDEIIHPIIQISRNNDVYISILTELLFKFNTYTEKICFNVEKTLKLNVNSTTSLMAYQPEMPAELNNIRKYHSNNDK